MNVESIPLAYTTISRESEYRKTKVLSVQNKSGKKTLEIHIKHKICKKFFDQTYIYDTTTGEHS